MNCVVQIGSRMLEFECGTTRRTLSCAPAVEKANAKAATARILAFALLVLGPSERQFQPTMSRIAVGGFQHETNTFAPSKAGYAAFEAGGGWPGVQYGEPIFRAVEGANIPAAGAIQALRAAGRPGRNGLGGGEPVCACHKEAFDRIREMVANLEKALPVDGVYLDLHGAMVSEEFEDGEGEILRRVRAVVGPRCPSWPASTCTPT